jgi:hypothetical protein
MGEANPTEPQPLSFEDFRNGLGFELPPVLTFDEFKAQSGIKFPVFVEQDDVDHRGLEVFAYNSSSRREEILKNGEVHGDDGLTVRELDAMGLGPKHELNLDLATTINFSDVYKYKSRMAVVGYVTKRSTTGGDGTVTSETVARTFYMSGSQGIWRYLPSHSDRSWYNKGHNEDSLPVPFEAQAMLGQIAEQPHVAVADSARPFFGTARSTVVEPGITYQREVSRNPIKLEGNFYYPPHGQLIPPKELDFQPGSVQAPDFETEPLFNWNASTNSISDVQFEVYPSRDKRLNYVFCRTKQNEAWLAYVEDGSEVTSLGIRGNWIRTGDLATPITEYGSQDGGYGVQPQGRYVNMWPNYLSKVPVLQRYLGVTKARAATTNR